jgi:hypothetical protein
MPDLLPFLDRREKIAQHADKAEAPQIAAPEIATYGRSLSAGSSPAAIAARAKTTYEKPEGQVEMPLDRMNVEAAP